MTHLQWRPAAALVAGVLAVHLLALQALSMRPGAGHLPGLTASTPVFMVPAAGTRTDAPAVDAAPAAPAPARNAKSPQSPQGARADAVPPQRVIPARAGEPGGGVAAGARVAPSARWRFSLSGQTRGRPWSGRAELQWAHDGHRYEARLELESEDRGSRSQRSTGSITAGGLVPERFSERTRSEEAVHFRHDSGRITFSANRPEAVLLEGAQDRLSVLLQLGALIAARPQAYPAGATLSVQTATARDAEVWRVRIEGHEELHLPAGHLSTMRLVRVPAGDYEPRIDLWLAPAMDYAPVRLRLTQASGDWLEYQWAGSDRR